MKWEYTHYTINDPLVALKRLDDHGNDGWELVSVTERGGYTWFWFKRRRTFLGVLPAAFHVMHGLLCLKSLQKKPKLVLQITYASPEILEQLKIVSEFLPEYDILCINGATLLHVGKSQTYFNWHSGQLPYARIFDGDTELLHKVVWVETESGLVGLYNEHWEIEVHQFNPGLRIEWNETA